MERPRSGTERTPCCRRAHRPNEQTTLQAGSDTKLRRTVLAAYFHIADFTSEQGLSRGTEVRIHLPPAESPIANLFEPVSGPPSCAVDRGPTRFSRRTALRRRQKRGTGALAPSRESDQWTELDVDWCRRIN